MPRGASKSLRKIKVVNQANEIYVSVLCQMLEDTYAENSARNLRKAVRNVAAIPFPMALDQLEYVANIGPHTFAKVKEVFQQQIQQVSSAVVPTRRNKKDKRKQKRKREPPVPAAPTQPTESPAQRKRRARKAGGYRPRENSAPWALVKALWEHGGGWMQKSVLIAAAQAHTMTSLTRSGGGNHGSGLYSGGSHASYYSGWSSMSTLRNKGVVEKKGRDQFRLSASGLQLAERLFGPGEGGPLLPDTSATTTTTTTAAVSPAGRTLAIVYIAADGTHTDDRDSALMARQQGVLCYLVECQRTHLANAGLSAPLLFPDAVHASANPQTHVCVWVAEQLAPAQASTGVRAPAIQRAVVGTPKRQRAAAPPRPQPAPAPRHPSSSGTRRVPRGCPVRVLVDKREKKSAQLVAMLAKQGVASQEDTLQIGDFMFVYDDPATGATLVLDAIVERKNIDDLYASTVSGHLNSQNARLQDCPVRRVFLLVEGGTHHLIQSAQAATDEREREHRTRYFLACLSSPIRMQLERYMRGNDSEGTTTVHMSSDLNGSVRFIVQIVMHLHAALAERDGATQVLLPSPSGAGFLTFAEFQATTNTASQATVGSVFQRMLVQIPRLTPPFALAITQVYPTVQSLRDAYTACETAKERQDLLKNLEMSDGQGERVAKRRKKLGPALSATVHSLFH